MKPGHEIEGRDEGADSLPLNPDSPPMNQPHLAEPARTRLDQVLARDVGNLRRPERMEVEHVGDRNLDRFVALHAAHCTDPDGPVRRNGGVTDLCDTFASI